MNPKKKGGGNVKEVGEGRVCAVDAVVCGCRTGHRKSHDSCKTRKYMYTSVTVTSRRERTRYAGSHHTSDIIFSVAGGS